MRGYKMFPAMVRRAHHIGAMVRQAHHVGREEEGHMWSLVGARRRRGIGLGNAVKYLTERGDWIIVKV